MADSDALEKLKKLTAREKEILKLFCEGYLYKDIGKKLFCSNSTVKSHMCNIYMKLGLDLLPHRARTIILSEVYCKTLKDSEYFPSEDEEGVEARTEGTVKVDAEETGEVGAEENIESDAEENVEENDEEKAEESEEASPEPISRALLKVVEEDDGGPRKDYEGEIIKIVPIDPPDYGKQFRRKPNPLMIGFMIIALISILFTGYSLYNRFFGPIPVPSRPSQEQLQQQEPQVASSADNKPEPTAGIQSISPATEIPVSSTTIAPKPAVLFEDNFDQGLSEDWEVISGNPMIVDGMLTSDQDVWLMVGNLAWKNYSVEFTAETDINAANLGFNIIGVREVDIDNMYAYKLSTYDTLWSIVKNGKWNAIPDSTDHSDKNLNLNDFRITVNKSSITFYINGIQNFSFVDSNYPQGRVVLKVSQGSTFDDFKVTEILD